MQSPGRPEEDPRNGFTKEAGPSVPFLDDALNQAIGKATNASSRAASTGLDLENS